MNLDELSYMGGEVLYFFTIVLIQSTEERFHCSPRQRVNADEF